MTLPVKHWHNCYDEGWGKMIVPEVWKPVENLEWVTPKENNTHAIKMGLWHPNLGDAHGRAKIHAADIPAIRECEGKETTGQVAKREG